MAEVNYSAFKAVLAALKASKSLYEGFQQWKGRPTKADQEALVAYCRRLDERRVFSAPFNIEVEEVCVSSVNGVKDVTEDVLSKLKHPAAQAALGAILDELRRFLDRWYGYRGPERFPLHRRGDPGFHRDDDGLQQQMEFFKDLGELRGRMKVFVGMIIELAPKAVAPTLIAGQEEGA